MASFCCSSRKCWCPREQPSDRTLHLVSQSTDRHVRGVAHGPRRSATTRWHRLQPRSRRSASRPSGSTYLGICPLAACCAASASRLATVLAPMRHAAPAHRHHADSPHRSEDARVAPGSLLRALAAGCRAREVALQKIDEACAQVSMSERAGRRGCHECVYRRARMPLVLASAIFHSASLRCPPIQYRRKTKGRP